MLGGNTEALGLHIDGLHVQVAHLRREGKRVVLVGMDSTTLVNRFDVGEQIPEQGDELVDTGDVLGLVDEPVLAPTAPDSGEDREDEGEYE